MKNPVKNLGGRHVHKCFRSGLANLAQPCVFSISPCLLLLTKHTCFSRPGITVVQTLLWLLKTRVSQPWYEYSSQWKGMLHILFSSKSFFCIFLLKVNYSIWLYLRCLKIPPKFSKRVKRVKLMHFYIDLISRGKTKANLTLFSQLSTLTFCARVQSVHIRTRLNLIVREVPPLDTSDLSAISGSKFRKWQT